jgi:cytochrome c oxidase assembly factor 4
VSSSEDNTGFHKRTKHVSECEIVTRKSDEEEDPVVAKLSKTGCLELHFKVQDCYFDSKDWRKCTKEVKEFQECLEKSKNRDLKP